jgi:DNA helicase INO80
MEQVNRAMYEIEQADKSDVEAAGFDAERERYQEKGQKRTLDSNRAEQIRRKVRHLLSPSM